MSRLAAIAARNEKPNPNGTSVEDRMRKKTMKVKVPMMTPRISLTVSSPP